jgi:CHAD domain-containing protein
MSRTKTSTPLTLVKSDGGKAAVGVAGAAAAGTVAWAHLVERRRRRQRAFELHAGEAVPAGVRRIACGRIDDAIDLLGSRGDTGAAVHGARKDLKRLRATARLVRGPLGERAYDRENRAFRDTARRLSGPRDSRVLVETLEGLIERYAGEVPDGCFDGLRDALVAEERAATARLQDDGPAVAAVIEELRAARRQVARWQLVDNGFETVEPGVRRTYRRGREAYRAARRDPSTERLHEWRKRVKDLWHATQILEPAAPKRLDALARDAHRLSDLLGDDHDLAVLGAQASRRLSDSDPDALELLEGLIARRRDELQKRALKRGRKLYAPSPAVFAKPLRRGWRKRMAGI